MLDVTSSQRAAAAIEWLPVGAGLLVLCVPTFYRLATGIWRQDDYAHGPIVLGVVIWLIWKNREVLFVTPARGAPAPGFAVLLFGLLLYAVGRSQEISIFEIGALIPILAGVLLAMRGWRAVHAFWFPLLFIAFMLPLPGFVVDALTVPLKQSIASITAQILYAAGYPIAHAGVVLTIGHYQLQVADACSGLNSMFSLSALGLLHLHLMRRESWLHNGIILACILPIAAAANLVRVLVLVLVTYHIGDEAGQSFLHGGAGIVLLAVALIIIVVFDAALARAFKPRRSGVMGNE